MLHYVFTWICPWRLRSFQRRNKLAGILDLGTVGWLWGMVQMVGVRVCQKQRAKVHRKRTAVLRRRPSPLLVPCRDRTRSWTSTPANVQTKRNEYIIKQWLHNIATLLIVCEPWGIIYIRFYICNTYSWQFFDFFVGSSKRR